MASDSKTRILRDAEKFVLQGKTTNAISEYLKIVKNDPADILTLNTIGDLYLKQGNVGAANTYFRQVAEAYTRNNFLLKAIAVYKKILNVDPSNLEVNSILAGLYVRQGLNVNARNQYLTLAELLERAGQAGESIEACEKVVELDQWNSVIRLKLADRYLEEGVSEKAQNHLAGAAAAQAKTGDLGAAVQSYVRASRIGPLDSASMLDFLEAALEAGGFERALPALEVALDELDDDPVLTELLGRAYLRAGRLEKAAECMERLVQSNESRYKDFFLLSRSFAEAGQYDKAAESIARILKTLIARRETESGVQACRSILQAQPDHLPTQVLLTEIFSATNDTLRLVEALECLIEQYRKNGEPGKALPWIEKIQGLLPESQKYFDYHREAFAAAHPGEEYVAPAGTGAPSRESMARMPETTGIGSTNPNVVEVDLLLNYGMHEKAEAMLLSMVERDVSDVEARSRLAAIYLETDVPQKAAEQLLLLSAIHQNAKNPEAAAKCLAEAKALAPDLADSHLDLGAFARENGIFLQQFGRTPSGDPGPGESELEVDLSGDLSEIFFKDSPETAVGDGAAEPESFESEIPPVPQKSSEEKLHDELQEVDFYIRLGFQDEARAKLDEISSLYPGRPEVAARYRDLSGVPSSGAPESAGAIPLGPATGSDADEGVDFSVFEEEVSGDAATGVFSASSDRMAEGTPMDEQPPGAAAQPALDPAELVEKTADSRVNTMFADLMDEIDLISDVSSSKEDFETHFNLGVAYREMALLDDAIKQFEAAIKLLDPDRHPREVIRCCGLLTTCFLDKGMPRSAVRWCQTGLAVEGLSSHEGIALRYDMAIAYTLTGEKQKALECLDFIFDLDPTYRDVAQRIDDLRGQP